MTLPPWIGAHSDLGSCALVRRGEWALRALRRLGVAAPPGSRLPKAIRLISRYDADSEALDTSDAALLRRIGNAHRTVWNLFVISCAAERRSRTSQPWFPRALLIEALAGADDPSAEGRTKARDTEFELYGASALALAGATVGFAEPDLELSIPGGAAGVACKRLRSVRESKLATRFSEAARQIERTGRLGLIAIDASAFLDNQALAPTEAGRHAQYDMWALTVMRAVERTLGRHHTVKGVLAFGYLSAWDTAVVPPRYHATHPTSFQLIEDDDDPPERVAQYKAYWERIQRNMQAGIDELLPSRAS